jgi:hypothetical protein
LVAIDDTIEGLMNKVKEQCDLLPDGMSADLEPLAELLEIVDTGEEKGIEFGKQAIPPPETVFS